MMVDMVHVKRLALKFCVESASTMCSTRAWHSMRRGQRIPMAALFRPRTVGTAETISPGYKPSGPTVCDPDQHTSQ